jgi:hypothetical protein
MQASMVLLLSTDKIIKLGGVNYIKKIYSWLSLKK